MLTIGEVIIAVLGSGGLWTLIQALINYKINKDSMEKQALKSLLRDAIFRRCEKALSNGEVSIEELENINGLYQPYKELGGNGTAKKLIEDVNDLEVK
jgi:hypothetical protein